MAAAGWFDVFCGVRPIEELPPPPPNLGAPLEPADEDKFVVL